MPCAVWPTLAKNLLSDIVEGTVLRPSSTVMMTRQDRTLLDGTPTAMVMDESISDRQQ